MVERGTGGVRRWGKMRDLICTDRRENAGSLFNGLSKFKQRHNLGERGWQPFCDASEVERLENGGSKSHSLLIWLCNASINTSELFIPFKHI